MHKVGADMEYLKKLVGYGGWGVLGGIFADIIIWIFVGGISFFDSILNLITSFVLLIPILGGIIGGRISKKWWGAVLGGCLISLGIFFGLMYIFRGLAG